MIIQFPKKKKPSVNIKNQIIEDEDNADNNQICK